MECRFTPPLTSGPCGMACEDGRNRLTWLSGGLSLGGVGARLLLLVAGLHAGLAFLAAVVEGAKPAVEGDQAVAVIHLEVFVVEVVDIGVAIDAGVLPEFDLVEAD